MDLCTSAIVRKGSQGTPVRGGARRPGVGRKPGQVGSQARSASVCLHRGALEQKDTRVWTAPRQGSCASLILYRSALGSCRPTGDALHVSTKRTVLWRSTASSPSEEAAGGKSEAGGWTAKSGKRATRNSRVKHRKGPLYIQSPWCIVGRGWVT